ncbi:MAG: TerB family tellurite resistance protein [Bacteroidales bacterium]|nr:TerB family tellurite resistance protein [Bacteroidales bacterium]
MENFSFTKQEMAAVIKMAGIMVAADGIVHQNEKEMMTKEVMRFNIPLNEVAMLVEKAKTMESDVAIATIAIMTDAQKRYVTAYLGAMIAIDGDVDDKEVALWSLVSQICHLPNMTIAEAIDYLDN